MNTVGAIIAAVGGACAILALLLGAAATWGAHAEVVRDQGRELRRLEQVLRVTHPATAEAFGFTRQED